MRRTPAGFGIQEITNQLNPPELRNPMRRRTAQSVDDITKIEDAQDVMRYGGKGVGRKLLFGATSTIVGEKVAKKVARKFGNKQQQEEAFQTLYGRRKRQPPEGEDTNQQQPQLTQSTTQSNKAQQRAFDSLKKSLDSTVERVVKAEVGKVIEELKNNGKDISGVKEVVERIEKRISPRDVTVGSGKEAQTFRFDPLAPEGREVTLVNKAGKSERLASKEGGAQSEYQKVLTKAAYFGAKDLQERRENVEQLQEEVNPEKKAKSDKIKKLKEEDAKKLALFLKKELKKELTEVIKKTISSTKPGGKTEEKDTSRGGPENFEEYSKMLDNMEKAQDVMRYGGTGVGRKFLFGATQQILGEKVSKKIARKFGNKKEQEEALQILKDPMYGIRKETEEVNPTEDAQPQQTLQQTQQPTPDTNLTPAQESAKEEVDIAAKQQQSEENKEFREQIMKKLDEILEQIKSGGGGGGGSSALSGGLMAAAGAALTSPAVRAALARAGSFALKRLLGPIGVGLTAYEVGGAINEATGASEKIADAFSDDKTPQEAEAEDKKLSDQGKAKINSKLQGTGFTALGGGKFQGDDGKIYNRSELPQEVQQKLPGGVQAPAVTQPQVTPEAKETATPPEPRKREEAPVQQLSEENDQLRREQQQQPPPVIVAPQQTNLQMGQQQERQSQPVIIQTRNTEPSVSTYVASIFDHPVVHPGIYKM